MCIAILSTTHPDYRLIAINNRDEFLNRPTSRADWWPSPHAHVLGARDLARPIHGTWLGVTKHGRLAILTNYHEATCREAVGVRSRGAIVNSWLTPAPADGGPTIDDFVDELCTSTEMDQIGGFNLLCGRVGEPLAIVSNRPDGDGNRDGGRDEDERVRWVGGDQGQTIGISNTRLGDRSWKKVALGERLMEEAIATSIAEGQGEDVLVQRLLRVLSTDTLPRLPGTAGFESYLDVLSESIFIPVIGCREKHDHDDKDEDCLHECSNSNAGKLDPMYLQGQYGTHKQTVVLIGHDGRVRYVERTLYDDDGQPVPDDVRDRSFEFHVNQSRA